MIISIIFGVIDGATGTFDAEYGMGLLGLIYALAVFLPGLAVTMRRLHDTDRSGWWILIALVPCAGLFDEFTLWDTSTRPPLKIATAIGKKLTIVDAEKWSIFIKKGEAKLK